MVRATLAPLSTPRQGPGNWKYGFSGVKNKPVYAIDSVDHALHLAQLLQQEGPLRVTDAAERLSVSVSTAHRLLAMLVYRDFAQQAQDRRYTAGPMMRPALPPGAPLAMLRQVAAPHLRALTGRIRESANLMILVDTEVRIIASVECEQVLRVGDRAGVVLKAHQASGGKVLLALLPSRRVDELYQEADDVDLRRLHRELDLIRERGFAINDQLTEPRVTAIGVAVRSPDGHPNAAISLSVPAVRFQRDRLTGWVNELAATAALIKRDLSKPAVHRQENSSPASLGKVTARVGS
ncbi:IclR family transcriptional regulator [Streptomyces sp. NPDC091217]|uniref:IclR family transcriptional regulator n=1 Tax=Streptomyces sp. NPDC091217 TaxID=3365975 RepID=UPI003806466F